MSENNHGISLKSMEFIHEGSDEISDDKFHPVVSGLIDKPAGGVWFCEHREGELSSWESWRGVNGFGEYPFSSDDIKGTIFTIKDDANIFVINSLDDAKDLISHFGEIEESDYADLISPKNVDWHAVSEAYDGLYLTENGSWDCHMFLFSWDVESGVLFNTDAIEEQHPVSDTEKDALHEQFEVYQEGFQIPDTLSRAVDTADDQRVAIEAKDNHDGQWHVELYTKGQEDGCTYKVFDGNVDVSNPYHIIHELPDFLKEYSGDFSGFEHNDLDGKELFQGSKVDDCRASNFICDLGSEINEKKDLEAYGGFAKHIVYGFSDFQDCRPTHQQMIHSDPSEITGTVFSLKEDAKIFVINDAKDFRIFENTYMPNPSSSSEMTFREYDHTYDAIYITSHGMLDTDNYDLKKLVTAWGDEKAEYKDHGMLCNTNAIEAQRPISEDEKQELIEKISEIKGNLDIENIQYYIENDNPDLLEYYLKDNGFTVDWDDTDGYIGHDKLEEFCDTKDLSSLVSYLSDHGCEIYGMEPDEQDENDIDAGGWID